MDWVFNAVALLAIAIAGGAYAVAKASVWWSQLYFAALGLTSAMRMARLRATASAAAPIEPWAR